MDLRIDVDFGDVQRRLGLLQDGVGTRALASAVNKTIAVARTDMQREITREFNVSAGYVRERLQIRRAVASLGRVGIVAQLKGGKGKRSANIIRFVEHAVTLAQGRKRAKAGTQSLLHVKVLRRGKSKPMKGAFIGNKGRTVFRRVGAQRLPIEPVSTVDVASMFNAKRINSKVVETIRRRLPDIFEREASFYVDRFNRGGTN